VVAVSSASIGATSDEVPSRDFWAVIHRSSRRVPKVRAVLDWLGRIRGFSVATPVRG
jgi:DNA-binding transcriptional LysR family regulator